MDRRDAFEQSWALRHRVSVEELREHRFETEDGYDLPALAAHYRTWQAAIDSVVVELPGRRPYSWPSFRNRDAYNLALDESKLTIEAAGIKVAP